VRRIGVALVSNFMGLIYRPAALAELGAVAARDGFIDVRDRRDAYPTRPVCRSRKFPRAIASWSRKISALVLSTVDLHPGER
jgi:hypothetical protein